MNNDAEHKDAGAEETPRGIIAWFSHNHVAANILMMLFLIGGLISVADMRTETFPSIDPKTIVISVPYPGATPYEVADSITSRVEEALSGTEGVKRIASTASEGYGSIVVELEDFADSDDVYNDVETSVNSLSDFPPEDAERPVVTKTKVTPNVLSLAIHGDVPEATLKFWAETIEEELLELPGVALTTLRGIRNYQISVEVSEETLRSYDLSLQDIRNAIARFSIDVPAGTIESSQGDVLLRIQEKGATGEDFEKMVLRTLPDGSSLRLGDIAHVVDGFEDSNLISKYNNEPAAFIDVARSATEDTLHVAAVAKDYLNSVKLPQGLHISLQADATEVLKDRISLMMRNAILGFMLVFVILLLFLDMKLAFWTSAAIPVSFLGGLMVIYFLGYSINMISLFALIVTLGIVVDDAIVMGESIFEAQEEEPKNKDAALKGIKHVIAPVTIGVLTTMAAFAPLIFSTGTLGQIIKFIPIVVIPILAVSLLEAYFILPAHLSNPKRWSTGIVADIRNRFAQWLEYFITHYLLPLSHFTMKWRYATLTVFIGLSIVTAALFSSGTIRFIFFPQIEGDEVSISVTMEEGTPFAVTQDTMLHIEREVNAVRDQLSSNTSSPFESIALSIGQVSNGGHGPGGNARSNNANHIGQIKIQLVPSDFREQSSSQIERMIRTRIEHFPNIKTLEFKSSLIGEEADIEVELAHNDEAILNQAAEELKTALKNINGTKEVDDSFELGKTEFVFELTEEGLAVGLTPSELGTQLRNAFFGVEAQRFQRGRSEVIVYVRYPKAQRESLTGLQNARIRLSDGSEVPLSSVARIKKQFGYSKIYTVNGRRIVSVTSDIDNAITTPTDVMNELSTIILPDLLARHTGLSYSFEGESREQGEDMASLGRNMLMAMLIIYVLLGAQLRSYIQPVVIMTAIPFGIVGAIWGHFLLGYDVSFISMFGIVALSGVVVNDSVVLMDYYNLQKANNYTTANALNSSVGRRFRPILLTTLTTSLGLLPMLLETSLQAQFLIPMVVSLATGILFSTFVILLFIPALIMIMDDIKHLVEKYIPKTR